MLISLVVAASTNNAIGLNNKLLWHLPNDLKFFKNVTWALPVIMGRKTFDALAGKPLNGRFNIVITRQENFSAAGIAVVSSITDAIKMAATQGYKEVKVIGGGEIYHQAMAIANRIYLTRVDAELIGDTYFPVIDAEQWKLTAETSFPKDEKHAYPYHFQVWEKIKNADH
jgi:dihydrofolate reductase